jgi:hypothetical protein
MLTFKTAPSPAFSVFTPRPDSPSDTRVLAVLSLRNTAPLRNDFVALKNNSNLGASEANSVPDDTVYLIHQQLPNSNGWTSQAPPISGLQRRDFSGNLPCKTFPRAIQDRSDSPEVLLRRFREQICPMLSITVGQNNMWQNLVFPMVHSSPSLWNAISAMAALHIPADDRLRIHGAELMGRSIGALNQELQSQTFGVATVAAILILAFWARWDQGFHSGKAHVNGAIETLRIIGSQSLERASRASLNYDLTPLVFLSDSCIYVHILSRLVNSSISNHDYKVASLLFIYQWCQDGRLPKGIWALDPWLFCASELLSFMVQAANLCHAVRMTSRNPDTIFSDAVSLKFELEKWKPRKHPSLCGVQVFDTDTKHLTHTAEACRYTTMLYLQQAVPLGMSTRKLAQDVFGHLSCVPPSSSVTFLQMYPLFEAARQVARKSGSGLKKSGRS